MKTTTLLFLSLFLTLQIAWSQNIGDYRTSSTDFASNISAKLTTTNNVFTITASPKTLATTYTSAQTGDWNDPNTWVSGIPSSSTDNVIIAATHIVNSSNDIEVQNLTIQGTGRLNLTSSSLFFTINGTLSIDNGGVLDIGSLDGPPSINTLTAPSGVSTIRVGGGTFPNFQTIGTYDNTNKVVFYGSNYDIPRYLKTASPTVNFQNVEIEGTGIKVNNNAPTIINANLIIKSGASFEGQGTGLVVNGNLDNAGVFDIKNISLDINGTSTVNGSFTDTDAGGTNTFNGITNIAGSFNVTSNSSNIFKNNVNINGSGVFTNSISAAIIFDVSSGNFGISNNSTSSSSFEIYGVVVVKNTSGLPKTLNLSGTGTATPSLFKFFTDLSIDANTTVTNNSTVYADGLVANATTSVWQQGNSPIVSLTLGLSPTSPNPMTSPQLGTFDASGIGNTVIYNRTSGSSTIQPIRATTYYNLTLSGNSNCTKQLTAGTINVLNNLLFTSVSPFDGNGQTINMTGTLGSNLEWSASPNTAFNLNVNKTSGGNITLTSPVNISGALTMTTGKIFTAGLELTLSGAYASQLTGSFDNDTHIVTQFGTSWGKLSRLGIPTGTQTTLFPIGATATNDYTPITITNVSNSGGSASVYVQAGTLPNNPSVNRIWNVATGFTTGNIDVKFDWNVTNESAPLPATAKIHQNLPWTNAGITTTYTAGTQTATATIPAGNSVNREFGMFTPLATDLTLAANTVPARNIYKGYNNNIVQSFSLIATNTSSVTGFSGIAATLSNPADFVTGSYKVYSSLSNDFNTAMPQPLVSAISVSATASFTFITSISITSGQTRYFWLTVDVASTATSLNTIIVSALSPANITTVNTKIGSTTPAGKQTIQTMNDKPLGNRGLYFDGSPISGQNDLLTVPLSGANNDNITLETWVKTSPTFKNGEVVRVGTTGGYSIYLNNSNQVWIDVNGVDYVKTLTTITPNQWTHIAIVRNAGTWSIYVNGVSQTITSGAGFAPSLTLSVLEVGESTNSTYQYFNGQVDDIRLFNSVRSAADIQFDMASTTPNGALGYWNFDDDATAGVQLTALNTSTTAPLYNGNLGGITNIPARTPLWALRVTNDTDNPSPGLGSLRQAIEEANTDNDTDYIDFSINNTTAALGMITLDSVLPDISNPIFIDGLSAFDSSNTLLRVHIKAGALISTGLNLVSSNSTIQGLIVTDATTNGIAVNTSGAIKNIISQNSVYGNGSVSNIALISGGNNSQPAPIIDVANTVFASGTCTFCANGDRVELFENGTTPILEGIYYRGFGIVNNGKWSVTSNIPMTQNNYITATITTAPNGTSQFSATKQIVVYSATRPLGNRGIYFDGVNDEIVTASTADMNFVSSDYTFEAWIKKDNVGLQRIITRANWSFGIDNATAPNSKIIMSHNGVADYVSNDVLLGDKKWHHIAAVRTGTTLTFYYDGNPAGTVNTVANMNSTGNVPIVIGRNTSGQYYKGQLDEIRVFNTARTQAEIQTDMATQTANGAVGYWNFDQSTGTTVTDIAGTNNGTIPALPNNPLWALRVTDNTDNAGAGLGSLRQAITEANTDNDTDYIDFSIQQTDATIAGKSTIAMANLGGSTQNPLPIISNPIFIDGYSAYGSSPNTANFLSPNNAQLRVELDCQYIRQPAPNTLPLSNGLNINTSDSQIRGLSIYGVPDAWGSQFGVMISTGTNNIIAGNYIGLKADGTNAGNNANCGIGISVATNNTIGGLTDNTQNANFNIVSNHDKDAMQINGSNNTIQGNYVGTDKTGNQTGFGNGGRGINLTGASNSVIRNLISGNTNNTNGNGIIIQVNANNSVVKGNYIGVKADLSGGLPNGVNGILITTTGGNTTGSLIGGILAGEANIIAYNASSGISIAPNNAGANTANGHKISGNSIYNNTLGGIALTGLPIGNNNKTAPTITSATVTSVSGTCVCAVGEVIELFKDNVTTPIANKQGKDYLGSFTITSANTWTMTTFVTLPIIGDYLTAMVTDGSNNTSRFSVAKEVGYPIATATAATNITGSTFTANWTNPSPAPPFYILQYSNDNFATFTSINSIADTATSQNVTGLGLNQTYRYRLVSSVDGITPSTSISNAKMTSTILRVGSGSALTFNGIDQYVNLGNNNSDFSAGVTMSAWVYPTANNSNERFIGLCSDVTVKDYIVLLRNGTSNNFIYQVYNSVGASSGFVISTSPMVNNTWQHIAVTHNGGTATLYLNGVQVGFGAVGMPPTVNRTFNFIGKASDNTGYYQGQIDEVAIYNRALTQAEIQANMCKKLTGSETGLLSYFRFDENTQLITENKARNASVDGTLSNNIWTTSGAYLGDISTNDYTGVSLSLASGITATNNLNVPTRTNTAGVHIYRVNSAPVPTTAVAPLVNPITNTEYFGVFLVPNGVAPSATIEYDYTPTTPTLNNKIAARTVNGVGGINWNGLASTISSNKVIATAQSSGEYLPAIKQTFYSRKTGAWNDATVGNATWSYTSGGVSCDCFPSTGSVVIIEGGFTVTTNANNQLDGSNITINGASTLDLANTTHNAVLALTSINGKLRTSSGIIPTFTTTNFFTTNTNTVEFYGTNSYNVPPIANYPNLTISDISTKILPAGTTTIGGNLLVNGRTFQVNDNNLTVNGTTTIGSGAILATDPITTLITHIYKGAILNNGTLWYGVGTGSSANVYHIFESTVTNAGSFLANVYTNGFFTFQDDIINTPTATLFNICNIGTGHPRIIFNTKPIINITNNSTTATPNMVFGNVNENKGAMSINTDVNIGGTSTGTIEFTATQTGTFGDGIVVAATKKLTNNYNKFVISRKLTGNGTFINNGTALYYGLVPDISNFTVNTSVNTVNYALFGVQDIRPDNYRNLSVSGSFSKTLAGSVNVAGNLTIDNATLNFGNISARTVTVTGNLVNSNGTIDMSGGASLAHTLNLNGTNNAITTYTTGTNNAAKVVYGGAAQQVSLSNNYQNLEIAGGSIKTLQANATINNTLTLTSGILQLGASNLTINNNATNAIAGGTTANYIETNGNGKLIRNITSGTTYNFPVGGGTTPQYAPASLTYGTIANSTTAVRVGERSTNGLPQLPAGFLNNLPIVWEINSPEIVNNLSLTWQNPTLTATTVKEYVSSWTNSLPLLNNSASGTSAIVNNITGLSGTTKHFSVFSLPTIVVSPSALSDFTSCAGTASIEQTYQVSGTNLSTDIAINAPTGFEISSGSGFVSSPSSLTLSPDANGNVANTTIYVRQSATASVGTINNINITHTSTNATTQNVSIPTSTVNPLPTPIITGNNAVCANSSQTYSVPNVAGNTYTWTIEGGTPTTATGISVNVTWGTGIAGTIQVVETVTATNCSVTANQSIVVNALPSPIITGNSSVCANSNQTYFVPNVAGSAYTWAITGGIINSGQNTNSISVIWGDDPIGANLELTQTSNGCTTIINQNIIINALPTASITGITNPLRGSTETFSALGTGNTYVWTITNGTIISGQGTDAISVTWGLSGASGEIGLTETNANGCANTTNFPVELLNNNPVITQTSPFSIITLEDNPNLFSLNATDIDSNVPFSNFVWSISTAPTKGNVIINTNNTNTPAFTYTPNLNENGNDTFIVTLLDGEGGTATITINVTIIPVNDIPVLSNQTPAILPNIISNSPIATFALNFATGPANEASQKFIGANVTSNNPAILEIVSATPTPALNVATGTMTLTIQYRVNQTATITNASQAFINFSVKDDGGVANGGIDTYNGSVAVKIDPMLPAPTNFLAAPLSGASVKLTWDAFNQNIGQGFEIQRDFSTTFTNPTTILNGNNNMLITFDDTGLLPGVYYYRIRAKVSNGTTLWSLPSAATVGQSVVNVPTNLQATVVSHTQIGLSWNDNSIDETSFELERASVFTNNQFVRIASVNAVAGAGNVVSYVDNQVFAFFEYRYRVRARSFVGISVYSNILDIQTTIDPNAPPTTPPFALSAQALSKRQIDLVWKYNNVSTQIRFQIERANGLTGTYNRIATIFNTAIIGDKFFNDTLNLVEGQEYCYRIRAISAGGFSSYCEPSCAFAVCNLGSIATLRDDVGTGNNTICPGKSANLILTKRPIGAKYQWHKNGEPIPDAIFPNYLANSTGKYKCYISVGTGLALCADSTFNQVLIVAQGENTPVTISYDGIKLKASIRDATGYQWYKNYNPIPNSDVSDYPTTENGVYFVIINIDGCTSTSNLYILGNATALEDADISNYLSISPNPTSEQAKMVVNAPIQGNYEWTITDISGKIILKSTGQKTESELVELINVSNFANGMYLIEWKLGKYQARKKLIKR